MKILFDSLKKQFVKFIRLLYCIYDNLIYFLMCNFLLRKTNLLYDDNIEIVRNKDHQFARKVHMNDFNETIAK